MNEEQQAAKRRKIQGLVARLNKNNKQLDVILELSASLVDVGDLEQAEELLARSLTLFPNNQDLIYNLGNVYFLAEKYDRAAELFNQLIDHDYGFEAYYMNAKTLSEQGNKSMAIAYALTATEKNPQDVDGNELLADLLMANGNFETAIDYYKKADQIKPSAKYNFNIGLCLMNLNRPYQTYLKRAEELDSDYFHEHEKKLADLQKYLTKNGGSDD